MPNRRRFLHRSVAAALGFTLAGRVSAQSYGQAFRVDGDDGRPVANMRLPGELTGRIEELHGITYAGAREADVTLYAFFDYNCPWCRRAAADVTALVGSDPALRVGLVNNPILSPMSAQAAKVVLAVQRRLGSAPAFDLYGRLLAGTGRIDGTRALDLATRTGLRRDEIEAIADGEEVRQALGAQMRTAVELGLSATPSYVLGNVGVLGHPGPKAMARMIAAMRRCDRIACG